MLDFGFQCGSPTHTTGISIPLISVSIAGLMAIFIDPVLARRVSESAVSIAIRQACSSLLDHRLSATSASAEYGLDPSTCKKMVKAINKVSLKKMLMLLLILGVFQLTYLCHSILARNTNYTWGK